MGLQIQPNQQKDHQRIIMYYSLLFSVSSLVMFCQSQHFFGPPAIGFGAGLVSQRKNFGIASAIVSKRSSKSYSHQSFIQATPRGVTGYRTSTYTSTDHFNTVNHVSYYQPNQYHYHSTPWSYRWTRSADSEAREKRQAGLDRIGDFNSLPVSSISKIAANVSVASQPQVWANDMVFKDQDDCSKRMLCELNANLVAGRWLSENEKIIANAFGKNNEIDIGAETLEFDLAAVLGKKGGIRRCELSFRRCETSVASMMRMINVEVEELEQINDELEKEAINIIDIENRLEEEEKEIDNLSIEELRKSQQSFRRFG